MAFNGIELIFSTFGFIYIKLRNQLRVGEAAKLFFLFKLLNEKERELKIIITLTC
jgi:hypothetical protein